MSSCFCCDPHYQKVWVTETLPPLRQVYDANLVLVNERDESVYNISFINGLGRQLQFQLAACPMQYSYAHLCSGECPDQGTDNYSVTGYRIRMERWAQPYIWNTYLPSGILVLISFISFSIPADQVPGRVALPVTTFLMLVNIAGSVRATGPKVRV